MPTEDRIVEEVHAVREAIARESRHDLERIIDAARTRQEGEHRRVVRLPPKQLVSVNLDICCGFQPPIICTPEELAFQEDT